MIQVLGHLSRNVLAMMSFYLQVTANDLIGNTIDCISANIPGNVLNTYCWIMSTFSVPGETFLIDKSCLL